MTDRDEVSKRVMAMSTFHNGLLQSRWVCYGVLTPSGGGVAEDDSLDSQPIVLCRARELALHDFTGADFS